MRPNESRPDDFKRSYHLRLVWSVTFAKDEFLQSPLIQYKQRRAASLKFDVLGSQQQMLTLHATLHFQTDCSIQASFIWKGFLRTNMGQFAETKFAEIGKLSLLCPVSREKIGKLSLGFFNMGFGKLGFGKTGIYPWIWDSLPKPSLPNLANCPYFAQFAEKNLAHCPSDSEN